MVVDTAGLSSFGPGLPAPRAAAAAGDVGVGAEVPGAFGLGADGASGHRGVRPCGGWKLVKVGYVP